MKESEKYTFTIKEIDLKGLKSNLNENEDKGESIFEKDIKKIIYLLYQSKADYVVFEDLDRYKNIDVFENLKQLNNLLNNYCKVKNENRVVKFIYMISDDLFDKESKTKFFDFILPISPVIADTKKSKSNHKRY
ncbi:YobI family P-loop NTPase [Mycoplasma yeatsii]|uniref:YobI-like P-loop NTPase domain-containing protein n=1 Tax=Mycoplasma yeatsii TaxID=51365 RepID=A0ABU0NEK0_9MOLU|nr:hypothetical protein [Mycoplasma yeatsii]MDQ0567876.1 hypothetical protein [Mycoplasma yeatsii]